MGAIGQRSLEGMKKLRNLTVISSRFQSSLYLFGTFVLCRFWLRAGRCSIVVKCKALGCYSTYSIYLTVIVARAVVKTIKIMIHIINFTKISDVHSKPQRCMSEQQCYNLLARTHTYLIRGKSLCFTGHSFSTPMAFDRAVLSMSVFR